MKQLLIIGKASTLTLGIPGIDYLEWSPIWQTLRMSFLPKPNPVPVPKK
jgi:hypothetical protein